MIAWISLFFIIFYLPLPNFVFCIWQGFNFLFVYSVFLKDKSENCAMSFGSPKPMIYQYHDSFFFTQQGCHCFRELNSPFWKILLRPYRNQQKNKFHFQNLQNKRSIHSVVSLIEPTNHERAFSNAKQSRVYIQQKSIDVSICEIDF